MALLKAAVGILFTFLAKSKICSILMYANTHQSNNFWWIQQYWKDTEGIKLGIIQNTDAFNIVHVSIEARKNPFI